MRQSVQESFTLRDAFAAGTRRDCPGERVRRLQVSHRELRIRWKSSKPAAATFPISPHGEELSLPELRSKVPTGFTIQQAQVRRARIRLSQMLQDLQATQPAKQARENLLEAISCCPCAAREELNGNQTLPRYGINTIIHIEFIK